MTGRDPPTDVAAQMRKACGFSAATLKAQAMHVRVRRRSMKHGGVLQFIVAQSRRTPAGPRSIIVATWTSRADPGHGYTVTIAGALAGAEQGARDWSKRAEEWRQRAMSNRRQYRTRSARRPMTREELVAAVAHAAARLVEAEAQVERLRCADAALPGWRWPGAVDPREEAAAKAKADAEWRRLIAGFGGWQP